MGIVCLSECPACSRHLRCGERSCPFCGAGVTSFMRVLDYRIKTSLNRSRLFSIGAALTAAGFTVNCEVQPNPMYGAACVPTCGALGGTAGNSTIGGAAGSATAGSPAAAGTGGAPTTPGAAGEAGESAGGGSTAEDGGAAGGGSGGVGAGAAGGGLGGAR